MNEKFNECHSPTRRSLCLLCALRSLRTLRTLCALRAYAMTMTQRHAVSDSEWQSMAMTHPWRLERPVRLVRLVRLARLARPWRLRDVDGVSHSVCVSE